MKVNNITPLNFSEEFLKVELISNIENLSIEQKAILINCDYDQIIIGDQAVKPWNSIYCNNIVINKANSVLCISLKTDKEIEKDFPYAKEVTQKWSSVYDIFPLDNFKETLLWSSNKDKINGVSLNLWYAKANTHCGIHNKHYFKEVHVQIYGIGRMQKFINDDRETIYQDVFMAPGFTHPKFYNDEGLYPWHGYYADTDCIFLAIEVPLKK